MTTYLKDFSGGSGFSQFLCLSNPDFTLDEMLCQLEEQEGSGYFNQTTRNGSLSLGSADGHNRLASIKDIYDSVRGKLVKICGKGIPKSFSGL